MPTKALVCYAIHFDQCAGKSSVNTDAMFLIVTVEHCGDDCLTIGVWFLFVAWIQKVKFPWA